MKAWQALHVLSPEGCFPFAKKRNGTVLGEGAGILVMESLEHAQARGAKILAEIVGYGMSSDAKDMVNPDIEGPNEAMRGALNDAQLSPSDIQYLNAHGTATTINDANETRAIKAVFGNHAKNLAISSTKSMHGHPLGAGGSIEAVACIQAMNENWVPPTIGLDEPDPGVRPRLRPQRRPQPRRHLRDVELLRLRWPQRGADLRSAAGLSRPFDTPHALRPAGRGAFAYKQTRICLNGPASPKPTFARLWNEIGVRTRKLRGSARAAATKGVATVASLAIAGAPSQ